MRKSPTPTPELSSKSFLHLCAVRKPDPKWTDHWCQLQLALKHTDVLFASSLVSGHYQSSLILLVCTEATLTLLIHSTVASSKGWNSPVTHELLYPWWILIQYGLCVRQSTWKVLGSYPSSTDRLSAPTHSLVQPPLVVNWYHPQLNIWRDYSPVPVVMTCSWTPLLLNLLHLPRPVMSIHHHPYLHLCTIFFENCLSSIYDSTYSLTFWELHSVFL